MIKSSNNGLFTIPAAPSGGTAVAQSGSADTYGSYVQLTASTGEADYIVGIRFEATTTQVPTYLSVQIGTGAGGSETNVGQANCGIEFTAGAASTQIGGYYALPYPIPVATTTRIAVKTASSAASAISWNITLSCHKQADLVDAAVAETSNVTQIDALATNGNNATLYLKQLNIINSAGDALVANSTGSNGRGAYFLGNGTGQGILAYGPGASGIQALSSGATSAGLLAYNDTAGYGFRVISTGTLPGASYENVGTGDAFKCAAGAGGKDINLSVSQSINGDLSGRVLGNTFNSLVAVAAQVDLKQIDGSATNGNNATLNLKQLNIVNSGGDALVATSTGSNGRGAIFTGNGSGSGFELGGGGTGRGLFVQSGTGARAAEFDSPNATFVICDPSNTCVLGLFGLTGNTDGLLSVRAGAGQDINLAGNNAIAGYLKGVASPTFTGISAQVDTRQWLGTTVATPQTAGIPDINVLNWRNTLQTAGAIPAFAAGAAGGLMISGANTGPWSVSGGVTYSNSGGTAFACTGGGASGHGAVFTGGGTGDGIDIVSGPSGVVGLYITCSAAGAAALYATSGVSPAAWFTCFAGDNDALKLTASGTGHDINCTGDGLIQANLGGRILGNTATAFVGIGVRTQLPTNTAISNFAFVMNVGGTPTTGLTVSGTRSIDGGAFAALANSITEIANGFYKVNLAAADLNGTVIALRFSAPGADDTDLSLVMQP